MLPPDWVWPGGRGCRGMHGAGMPGGNSGQRSELYLTYYVFVIFGDSDKESSVRDGPGHEVWIRARA